MAKEKDLALPTGVTGNYHPIAVFNVRRPLGGGPTRSNPSTGTVVVDVNHYVSRTAREAGAQALMVRAVSIPLGDLDQSVVDAFIAELWKQVNIIIDVQGNPTDGTGGTLADLYGGVDVFESGQSPAP